MDDSNEKPDRPSIAQSIDSAQHSMDEKVDDARDTFNTAVEGNVTQDEPIQAPATLKRGRDYTPGGTREQSVNTGSDEKAIADAKADELARFDEVMGPGHDIDLTNEFNQTAEQGYEPDLSDDR